MSHSQRVFNAAIKEDITISLDEFFSLLENHDWHSSFSDSFKVQKLGTEKFKLLTRIASTHPRFKALLDQYRSSLISHHTVSRENLIAGEHDIQTEYADVRRSEYGILLRTSNEEVQCSDVWDCTTSSDGHFSIDEIDGNNIGVFPAWDIALSVAAYATRFPDGGFNDVIIKNVTIYKDLNDWL